MKVLLTTPTYPPFNSGLGNVVARQAAELSARGVEVVVATGGTRRHTRREGHLRIEEFAVTGAECLHRPIRGDIAGYVDFLHSERADAMLMHAWQTWSTDLALQQAANIRAKKILCSHCISTNSFLSFRPIRSAALYVLWRPYWWSLADKMRRLDAIVFLADAGNDDRFDDVAVAREVGIPIHIIPNSISAASAASAGRAAVRSQISAVGSYTKAKGFDFVLRAYAGSTAKNHIALAFFGQEHTVFLDELRDLSRGLGIDPSMVSFNMGIADDLLVREYRRSRLIVSGSHTECQPLVLLDAMATGTPFVARTTGCISQMAGGVSVKSESEATAAIDRLLADEAAWNELRLGGLRAASETYNPARNADLLMNLLRGAA